MPQEDSQPHEVLHVSMSRSHWGSSIKKHLVQPLLLEKDPAKTGEQLGLALSAATYTCPALVERPAG